MNICCYFLFIKEMLKCFGVWVYKSKCCVIYKCLLIDVGIGIYLKYDVSFMKVWSS